MAEGEPAGPTHARAASASPNRTSWGTALVLFGAGVMVAVQIGKAVAALPTLRADLGLSLVTSGWVIAAVNIAGGLFGLLLGAGVDRLGARRGCLLGLALAAVSSAGGALAPGAPALLVSRFGEGMGYLLTSLAVPALLVRISTAADRGKVFGLWGSFMPVGTSLGLVTAPVVIDRLGWRGLWVVCAGLAAVWAVVTARATGAPSTRAGRPSQPVDRSGAGDASGPLRSARRVLGAPGPPLLAGTFAVYAAQYLSVFAFLPILLTARGLSPGTAALLTAATAFVNAPGNLFGGWLRSRGAPAWLLICGASVVMGGSGVGIYHESLPLGWRLACCLALSFSGGLIPASLIEAAAALAPSPGAVAASTGLVMQGSTLGQVAGPPLVAAIATAAGGWSRTPVPLGASAAVAFVLALALRRVTRRAATRAEVDGVAARSVARSRGG